MGVGDEDMADPLLGEARQQRRDMLLEFGGGGEHRPPARADDIGAGAFEGERTGIAGDNAADARRDPFEPAVFEGDLATIGNLDSHGRFDSGWVRAMCCHPRTGLSCPGRACGAGAEKGKRPMKIKFDIDCTPEELRGFFGLPDVKPMQEELMQEVAERMRANVTALDPETMLKTWLPAGLKGFEQLQEMFLNQMAGRPGGGKK